MQKWVSSRFLFLNYFLQLLDLLTSFFITYYILEMNDLVDEMIEAVDDGDGEIDYDEFVSMIQKY